MGNEPQKTFPDLQLYDLIPDERGIAHMQGSIHSFPSQTVNFIIFIFLILFFSFDIYRDVGYLGMVLPTGHRGGENGGDLLLKHQGCVFILVKTGRRLLSPF